PNQRLADSTQIVIQAPSASSAAPVTIFQTVTANAAPTSVAQLPATAPVSANQAAAAVAPVVAPITVPATAQALVQAAPAPAAQVAVPAAAPAQPVSQAAAGAGVVQAPAANLSEGVLTQPIPAAGAALAEPVGAPVYAQQQLYPIAAAAQPIYQQPAVFGNSLQPAIILNGNQALPQAVIPLDQSLAELLTQSLASAPAPASLSSKASHATPTAAAAASLDSVGDADTDDSSAAAAAAAPEDDDSVPVSPRRSSRSVSRAARAKSRQSKVNTEDANVDAADAPVDDTINPVQDDQADSEPVSVSNNVRKSKSTGKNTGVGQIRKNANRDSTQENPRLASVANFKTASPPSPDDIVDDAGAGEYNEAPSYNRAHVSRTRYVAGGLRAEAQRIKSEASAEAREAVLSEVRAEASAEAALQASSELNMSVNTIVRDEEASSERAGSVYDSPQDYHTRERMQRGTT
ncbi:hypothetical protein GGI23_007065, partial [Coemansia sp. RSA 2559]